MQKGEKSIRKAGLGIIVAVMLLLAVLVIKDTSVYAEDLKTGVVTADVLNVRKGPGTSYDKIGKLYEGDQVRVTGEETTGGVLWYQIIFESSEGWVSSEFLEIQVVDVNFKEYLSLQGFPESYHDALTTLHAKYPNWNFEAQITNLDWEEVIEEESVLGKNLTHTSNPSSWKSVQNGAYDWTTGTWVGLDSASWVAASTEIIEYYMDPRNFLSENYIFQFIKQSYDADTDYEENLTAMVQGTFLAGTFEEVVSTETGETSKVSKTYVSAILEAAQASGVSPFTLATMIIQEQGVNGTGGCISGVEPGYEGYYNFFNVGAYAVDGLTPVQKGLQYASGSGSYGRPWNTIQKSITGGAIYFGESYVKKGQDTIYLKKFNVQGDNLYSHQYMTNVQGAASEGYILSEAYDTEARKLALTFKIPVYTNMPETACVKPTGDGSPNNMLKSLSVEGQSLTPTFSMYENTYSVIVENKVSSVTVAGVAYDSKATITGTGTTNLKVGENVVKVTVKAQNGTTRTYQITIIREESEEIVIPTPSVTSSSYKLSSSDKLITGISTFPVSASDFAKEITVKNGTLKVLKADGTAQTGNVGTGNVVEIYDSSNTLTESYEVLIYGDANGDGKVNAQDLLAIQKNNIQIKLLTGIQWTAADVNKDGKVNAQDLLRVQKHNIKIKPIEQ